MINKEKGYLHNLNDCPIKIEDNKKYISVLSYESLNTDEGINKYTDEEIKYKTQNHYLDAFEYYFDTCLKNK